MATKAKLTLKVIGTITRDYYVHLPAWQMVGNDMLARVSGPIAQVIWFDRLRTGAYRPTCRIHILAAPDELGGGTVVMSQLLGVKNRDIDIEQHTRLLPAVLKALQNEVSPPIHKPLDGHVVAGLLSQHSGGRPAGAYATACLYAALGRISDARYWMAEYYKALKNIALPEQPIDIGRSAFLKQLEGWMQLSNLEYELEKIVSSERLKLFGEFQ